MCLHQLITLRHRNRIALYHYVLKSWEDFATKLARGTPTENRKTWEFFDTIDSQATNTCDFAVQLGQQCCTGITKQISVS